MGIRQAIKDSMAIHKLIDGNIKELPNYLLCFFYADKKKHIQELVSEENIQNFKQMLPSVKWNLNTDIFKELEKKISELDLVPNHSGVQLEEKHLNHKISKKKLRKISKIPNIDKVRRPR